MLLYEEKRVYAKTSARGGSSISINYSNSGTTGELKKLHLKSCIKITSGTGSFANPYILEKKGTC